jgi:hypothetical protein
MLFKISLTTYFSSTGVVSLAGKETLFTGY